MRRVDEISAGEDKDDKDDKDDEGGEAGLARTLGLTLSLWFVVERFGGIVHGRVLVLAGIIRLWPWRVNFLLCRADRDHRRSRS